MSNPRELKEQIAREETQLAQLLAKESTFNGERRELLLKSVRFVGEEERLIEIHTELQRIHDVRDRLNVQIAERQLMYPELVEEQVEAEKRLEALHNEIVPLAKELTEADTETLKLYRKAIDQQERANELEQRLTNWVTEAQYLSSRFELNGSGLRVPGRASFGAIGQRIKVLASITPTRPSDFKEAQKVLNQQRQMVKKKQRRDAMAAVS